MSKTVLVVEKDVNLMRALNEALTARGFEVQETTDGKGSPELVRKNRPDCVVLAVDLDAGQNGYILCGKFKKDDDLKSVPIIIIGDPKGFAQHQKLKTRADEYVGKPIDNETLINAVGKLAGFPEPPPAPAEVEETFDPSSILDEEQSSTAAEEIALESASTGEETVGNSDPDFEMVDAIFDDKPPVAEENLNMPAEPMSEEALSAANIVDEDESNERTIIGAMPVAPPPPAPPPPPKDTKETKAHRTTKAPSFSTPPPPPPLPQSNDVAEMRDLRSKVTELTGSLEDAQKQSSELEARVRELEQSLETKTTELEAARASAGGGKSDSKEVFTLKDSINKKDKEILRLKSEVNEKEKEIFELRDKENALEQAAAESTEELGKRDAQIKTLQTKYDTSVADKKKVDTQLTQAKEEARSATAKLSTLQSDFDSLQIKHSELERAKQQTETELSETRSELETLRPQVDEKAREAEAARAEAESARNSVSTQAQAFADEISNLRSRVQELEGEVAGFEEKSQKLQQRIKAQQSQADRVREALNSAVAQLEPLPNEDDEVVEIDEVAEA